MVPTLSHCVSVQPHMTQTPECECMSVGVCVSHGPILPPSVSQLISVSVQHQNRGRKKYRELTTDQTWRRALFIKMKQMKKKLHIHFCVTSAFGVHTASGLFDSWGEVKHPPLHSVRESEEIRLMPLIWARSKRRTHVALPQSCFQWACNIVCVSVKRGGMRAICWLFRK